MPWRWSSPPSATPPPTAGSRSASGAAGRWSATRLGGLVALAVALAITTAFANLLAVLAPGASRALELAVLVAANGLATVARFVLLRSWIPGDHRQEPIPTSTSGNTRHGSLS